MPLIKRLTEKNQIFPAHHEGQKLDSHTPLVHALLDCEYKIPVAFALLIFRGKSLSELEREDYSPLLSLYLRVLQSYAIELALGTLPADKEARFIEKFQNPSYLKQLKTQEKLSIPFQLISVFNELLEEKSQDDIAGDTIKKLDFLERIFDSLKDKLIDEKLITEIQQFNKTLESNDPLSELLKKIEASYFSPTQNQRYLLPYDKNASFNPNLSAKEKIAANAQQIFAWFDDQVTALRLARVARYQDLFLTEQQPNSVPVSQKELEEEKNIARRIFVTLFREGYVSHRQRYPWSEIPISSEVKYSQLCKNRGELLQETLKRAARTVCSPDELTLEKACAILNLDPTKTSNWYFKKIWELEVSLFLKQLASYQNYGHDEYCNTSDPKTYKDCHRASFDAFQQKYLAYLVLKEHCFKPQEALGNTQSIESMLKLFEIEQKEWDEMSERQFRARYRRLEGPYYPGRLANLDPETKAKCVTFLECAERLRESKARQSQIQTVALAAENTVPVLASSVDSTKLILSQLSGAKNTSPEDTKDLPQGDMLSVKDGNAPSHDSEEFVTISLEDNQKDRVPNNQKAPVPKGGIGCCVL